MFCWSFRVISYGPIPEERGLPRLVVLDLEVGEEDDGGVGGQEDEDMPGTVQVREPNTRPEITEYSANQK